MRAGLAAAAVLATACAGAPPPSASVVGIDEGDAGTPDPSAAPAVRESELRWLASHLADDADPSRTGESPAVRRLVMYGAAGVRVVAEVFRVGDERRATYARSVVERVMRQHCRRDVNGIARTRRWLFAAAADASVAAWPEGARWPLDRVMRLRSWADHDAPCEPED